MTNTTDEEPAVPDGSLEDYVDTELFGGSIGSLDSHINRKQALANPYRYSILYLLNEHERLERPKLLDATGADDDTLEHLLRPLLNVNLIARVPAPDGIRGQRTYYRITTLGQQEIEADIRNIHPEDAE